MTRSVLSMTPSAASMKTQTPSASLMAALTRYKESLVANSRDWFYADNALRTSTVKWKN